MRRVYFVIHRALCVDEAAKAVTHLCKTSMVREYCLPSASASGGRRLDYRPVEVP
jgi:hypothetical protein